MVLPTEPYPDTPQRTRMVAPPPQTHRTALFLVLVRLSHARPAYSRLDITHRIPAPLAHGNSTTTRAINTQPFRHADCRFRSAGIICHGNGADDYGRGVSARDGGPTPSLASSSRASFYVREFCEEMGIPYVRFGFVKGNREVIGRLAEVAAQLRVWEECRKVAVRDLMEGNVEVVYSYKP
ncbi:hypothetical protein BHYA_0105g00030 [Botrytis hyacinthi]|uniref:Uncharacterized protein n=1 Tax=Botrytis hyacinthi TaxID=278943 RepID=A0A4Z1GNS4_9HELO|nr:hypothetical protein BHYA_0105g00030 [Botrytis hyacinthi]